VSSEHYNSVLQPLLFRKNFFLPCWSGSAQYCLFLHWNEKKRTLLLEVTVASGLFFLRIASGLCVHERWKVECRYNFHYPTQTRSTRCSCNPILKFGAHIESSINNEEKRENADLIFWNSEAELWASEFRGVWVQWFIFSLHHIGCLD
jgi:hypothetical protein